MGLYPRDTISFSNVFFPPHDGPKRTVSFGLDISCSPKCQRNRLFRGWQSLLREAPRTDLDCTDLCGDTTTLEIRRQIERAEALENK